MRCKNQIVIARLNCQVSNRDCGKMVAFKLRPIFSSINRNPKSKFGPEKEQIRLDQVFLDYMCVSTNAFGVLSAHERRPSLTIIGCFENIRRHFAKGLSIKRGVSCAGVEFACLHPGHPGIYWQIWYVGYDIRPRLAALTSSLDYAVYGADPHQRLFFV